MAIKSFQGARKQKEKCSGKLPFRVCDFMSTDLITFRPDQKVIEVAEILI